MPEQSMAEKEPSSSRIRDARGRLATQLDPVRLHVLHRYEVIEAETLHEIVEDLEPGTARIRRHMILIIPGLVVVVAGLGLAAYYFGDPSFRRDLISTLTNPAIMAPNVLCCLFVPWIAARQARLKRLRFAMLKHRRCPHCGYYLHGLPTAPEDGATVCPECGCAWLIDDAQIARGLAATATKADQTKHKRVLAIVVGLLIALALAGSLAFFWAA